MRKIPLSGVAGLIGSLLVASPARGQTLEFKFLAWNPSYAWNLDLDPGLWSITAAKDAWNAWSGRSTHCLADGTACTEGWLSAFVWSLNGGPDQYEGYPVGYPDAIPQGSSPYETAALALANAPVVRLNVSSPSRLHVWIYDSKYEDNIGGPTITATRLSSTVTPEPAALVLLGTGLAGLGAVRRHRRSRA